MIVLGIDTATESVSVAVVDGEEVLAAGESRSERRHAEDLTPMIESVVGSAGIVLGEVDAVAVDVGPGLFTGMRVGIASAQSLAHVLSVPLVAVDGLEALVAAAPAFDGDLIVPTIDARRGQVAWALHRADDWREERNTGSGAATRSLRVAPAAVTALDDLTAALRERAQACLFVGDFARRRREAIVESLGMVSWVVEFASANRGYTAEFPHARQVALIAHRRLLDGETLSDAADNDPTRAAPCVPALYLREADAEINWTTRSNA